MGSGGSSLEEPPRRAGLIRNVFLLQPLDDEEKQTVQCSWWVVGNTPLSWSYGERGVCIREDPGVSDVATLASV